MDEVCVLGVPDPYSGEIPVALVVLGDDPKERVAKDDKEAKRITISILKVRFPNGSGGFLDGGVDLPLALRGLFLYSS